MSFKKFYSLYERSNESRRIMNKYPQKIPIICESNKSYTTLNKYIIDKSKYLVSHDLTIGQFIYILRKRIQISPQVSIFLFVDGLIPPSNSRIIDIYAKHQDNDGFLYLTYYFENVFG